MSTKCRPLSLFDLQSHKLMCFKLHLTAKQIRKRLDWVAKLKSEGHNVNVTCLQLWRIFVYLYLCVRIVQTFVSSQWRQLSNSKIEKQSECCTYIYSRVSTVLCTCTLSLRVSLYPVVVCRKALGYDLHVHSQTLHSLGTHVGTIAYCLIAFVTQATS